MPELPEVETIVRGLRPYLEGAEMGTFRLLFPPLLRRAPGVSLAASLAEGKLKTLWKSMRAILRLAISRKGSSIRDYTDADGDPGDFQALHKVYGREGEKCPRCKEAVRRIKVGGRSTFYCPHCQKKL